MTANISAWSRLTDGQVDQWQGVNDILAAIDQTDTETKAVLVDNTNAASISKATLDAYGVFVLTDDASAPTAAITITINGSGAKKRGLFGMRSANSYDATITCDTQTATAPTLTAGTSGLFYYDGADVYAIASGGGGGTPNLDDIVASGALALVDWADVASAATCDIGAATSNFVRITGTTTITGLGTSAATVWRIVRFAAALTLTYNVTSLILPGAADITTAAGDCCLLKSDGSGNWRCLAYWKADGQPVSFGNALFSDTAANLTAGFSSSGYDNGTQSTGTFTPDVANGNFQVATNGGAHALASPTLSGSGDSVSMVLTYTNNASAGAVDLTAFDVVHGAMDTTNGAIWRLFITVDASGSEVSIVAGDAISVDEADTLIRGASVINMTTTAPPGSPGEGDAYIVGASATGAWSGYDDYLTIYFNAAWNYFAPVEGWRVYNQDDALDYQYSGSAWGAVAAGAAYETGTWSPVPTFATPGDSSVSSYSNQDGYYTIIGNWLFYEFDVWWTFNAYTTASGDFEITGLPDTGISGSAYKVGVLGNLGGLAATADQISLVQFGASGLLKLQMSTFGSGNSNAGTSELPASGSYRISGSGAFRI